VLLQRSGRFLSEEEIKFASEKGWSRSFEGKEDPMSFVVQNGPVTIIKAGGLVVNALQARVPYLGDPIRLQRSCREKSNKSRGGSITLGFRSILSTRKM
jgi:hypothetical protein